MYYITQFKSKPENVQPTFDSYLKSEDLEAISAHLLKLYKEDQTSMKSAIQSVF